MSFAVLASQRVSAVSRTDALISRTQTVLPGGASSSYASRSCHRRVGGKGIRPHLVGINAIECIRLSSRLQCVLLLELLRSTVEAPWPNKFRILKVFHNKVALSWCVSARMPWSITHTSSRDLNERISFVFYILSPRLILLYLA